MNNMILVIAEQRDGKLNRATWEAIAAAQQLAADGQVSIVVLGANVGAVAAELAARRRRQEVVTVERAGARAVHARRLHGRAGAG